MELITYALREITIGGLETVGRPFEWQTEIVDSEGNDETGEPALPYKYLCSCPHCGNAVEFTYNMEEVQCPECGAGQNVYTDQKDYDDVFVEFDDSVIEDLLDKKVQEEPKEEPEEVEVAENIAEEPEAKEDIKEEKEESSADNSDEIQEQWKDKMLKGVSKEESVEEDSDDEEIDEYLDQILEDIDE